MATWLLPAVSTASVLAAATNYHALSGAGSGATVEAPRQTYVSGSYTLSNLWVRVTTSTISAGSGTVRTRINSANGSQAVSITGTGTFEDTTNIDSLAAADLPQYRMEGATTGAYTPSIMSVLLSSSTAGPILPQGNTGYSLAASTTAYPSIVGGLQASATESTSQVTARFAGTISNLRGYLGTNPTATVTVRVRKNGADGNGALSWASGVTGAVRDTTNTDSFSAGDLVCLSANNASGVNSASFNLLQADLNTPRTWIGFRATGTQTQAEPLTRYYAFSGLGVAASTESDVQLKVRGSFVAKNLCVPIPTNGITGTTTVTLRNNAADTALTVSIGSGSTGVFEDTTHSVTLAPTDLINLAMVTPSVAGTPTISYGCMFVQLDPNPPFRRALLGVGF